MARKQEFGSQWWAQRWLAVLESFGWASRLQRGRTYARRGHVLDLQIAPGQVKARVEGSRPTPYRVSIQLAPLSATDWNLVLAAMAEKAIFAARLLAGEMPAEIEAAFTAARVPLFPRSAQDLTTSCSCPDWANPCKHVAAVCYRLGQEFDTDPFLLFRLRGRDREAVLTEIQTRRTAAAPTPAGAPATPATGNATAPPPDLALDLNRFWTGDPAAVPFPVQIKPAAVPGAILRRLGIPTGIPHPDLWHKQLAQYYQVISQRALAQAAEE